LAVLTVRTKKKKKVLSDVTPVNFTQDKLSDVTPVNFTQDKLSDVTPVNFTKIS
jgi:hypothetical protein